jgi:hypothetical protein
VSFPPTGLNCSHLLIDGKDCPLQGSEGVGADCITSDATTISASLPRKCARKGTFSRCGNSHPVPASAVPVDTMRALVYPYLDIRVDEQGRVYGISRKRPGNG